MIPTRRWLRGGGMIAAVAAFGALVAGVVTRASSGVGSDQCRDQLARECLALTRTYSLRVGLVTGVVAVLMLLMVAGLLRMVALDEARRGDAAGAPE